MLDSYSKLMPQIQKQLLNFQFGVLLADEGRLLKLHNLSSLPFSLKNARGGVLWFTLASTASF